MIAVTASCDVRNIILNRKTLNIKSGEMLPDKGTMIAVRLDATFGSDGKVSTDFLGGDDWAFGLAITPNGRAMVVGYAAGDENPNFAMACYRAYFVIPQITGAEVDGKKLYVHGKDFDNGAELLMNGEKQKKTFNDEVDPRAMLIAKKSGKKIAPGETVTLQVRNSDGALSNVFSYTRPVQ